MSKTKNALPPLRRNASLDKVKSIDKLGSSLSPLSSPKPKQSSLSSQKPRPSSAKSVLKSSNDLAPAQLLSTNTQDVKSSPIPEPRFNEIPRNENVLHLINMIYIENKFRFYHTQYNLSNLIYIFVTGKRLSFAKNLASSESQGSYELDSSPKRSDNTKKSILRTSPLRSDPSTNQSLRASLMQKDEKHIQFNLEKEDDKMELQVPFHIFTIYI